MPKFSELKFKYEKKKFIIDLLERQDEIGIEANMRGLLRIYQLQTTSEQMIEHTAEDNGVGFTGFDGEFMTSLAKNFMKIGSLTPKQYGFVVKNMKKYAGQLLKVAMGKIIECEIESLIPQRPVSQWIRNGAGNPNQIGEK